MVAFQLDNKKKGWLTRCIRYCVIGLIFLFLLPGQIILFSSEAGQGNEVFWKDIAPNPYVNSDTLLVKNSYQEKWARVSSSEHRDAVEKAREIIAQWGFDLEKGPVAGTSDRPLKYDIYVSESEHFIGIVFVSVKTEKDAGFSIEIRMEKKDFEVAFVLPGA